MYKNILVPIDFDHEDGTRQAFDVARLLAEGSAKLTVIHIIESMPGYVRAQISEEILQDRHAQSERLLKEAAAKLEGSTAQLVSGHAGQTIVQFADAHDIDCIILSSHKPGFEDFFIGSTANRVVHHAKCSVHVIR